MEKDDNTSPVGGKRRSNGDHAIGDSMPGTVGDAQRVLHDRNGQTPVDEDIVLDTANEERQNQESVEDEDIDVKSLVKSI